MTAKNVTPNTARPQGDYACPKCGKSISEEGVCDACATGKKRKADGVRRYDTADAPYWMTRKFERTPEGFLTGRAVVTTTGIFTYRDAEGNEYRELRLPEEVFHPDSLASLKLKPVTNDHPMEQVTAENVKEYQVGALGTNPSSTTQERNWNGYSPDDALTDGYNLSIDMTIQEAGAVSAVVDGKRALSCGYVCDLEEATPGAVWCGQPYDFIQRRIRYNHVALVDAARAGDSARIRLDSADAVLIKSKARQEDSSMPSQLKTIRLDGVDYEAEPPVITALSRTREDNQRLADQAKADAATIETHTKTISRLEGERDSAVERADKAEQALKAAQEATLSQEKIDAAVAEKITLLTACKKAGVEIKQDHKDDDLKKEVILKVFPNAKLDGKDATYIQARFDGAVETLSAIEAEDAETNETLGGVGQPATQEDSATAPIRMDSNKAREKMIAAMTNFEGYKPAAGGL